MPSRLPDPPGHQTLLRAIAELAAGTLDQASLLVLPAHFSPATPFSPPAPNLPRIDPDATPQPGPHRLIIAVDLWSEAANPETSLARLRAVLAPDGRLVLIQTNWPQRRGFVAPEAGGPPRSPDFYAWRSALAAAWPEARPGLVGLDHGLVLEVTGPDGVAGRGATRPLDAVAFVASDPPPAPARAALPAGVPADPAALAEVSPAIARGAVRQLAFVIDVPGWAYENIVDHIAPRLAGRYEVTRFFIADHPDRMDLLGKLFVENRFDNIHFMWRELWFNTLSNPGMLFRLGQQHGLGADQLAERIAAPTVTTTIYDHLFLEPDEVDARRMALALTDGYATASDRLAGIHADAHGRAPDAITPDGVDTGFFTPAPARPTGNALRVGWVGNSGWGKGKAGMGDDPKGLHSILEPAIALLRAEGHAVELVLADRNQRLRSRAEMRDFYADEIDLLVCSSAFEGTPNPVLEAMASGRTWVSTDVGIVREVAGPVQQGLILPARTPEAMAAALRRLILDPALLAAAGAENAARAAGIDWRMRVAAWTRLFAGAEARHAATHRVLRRKLVEVRLLAHEDGLPSPPELHEVRRARPSSLPAAHAHIHGLEEWLDKALHDNAERDRWIDGMKTREAELEGWANEMQAHIARQDAALQRYQELWRNRLAPGRLLRAAGRRLIRHRDG